MPTPSVDDVVNAHSAYFVCDRRDDITAKFSVLAHVFSFEAELVLLRHVVPSQGTYLIHDVEEDGFRGPVALQAVI